jgi:hypothetical protein
MVPRPGGVSVFHFARIDEGHSFEPAMRGLAHATALVRRRERHGDVYLPGMLICKVTPRRSSVGENAMGAA